MSLYNYQKSIKIVAQNFPLDSIIMAAIHQASGYEEEKLRSVFSALYFEVMERDNNSRGVIDTDGK